MESPYLTLEELDILNKLLEKSASDTISYWILTRLNGVSGSMAYEGNESKVLLDELDKQIKPLITKQL